MHRSSLRTFFSLLLVFALLSMGVQRAAMALTMGMMGTANHMRSMNGDMQLMTYTPSQHATPHPGQHVHHGRCGCGTHCYFCCICHATMSTGAISDFSGTFALPNGPAPLGVTELSLPLDPRPPRV